MSIVKKFIIYLIVTMMINCTLSKLKGPNVCENTVKIREREPKIESVNVERTKIIQPIVEKEIQIAVCCKGYREVEEACVIDFLKN